MPTAMGQPIVVTEKSSSNPGVVRFETNRALTGMGHERYRAGEEVFGERPPDELARRMFDRGGVAAVHVNSNMVTVDLEKGYDARGLRELIEDLYIFYPDRPAASDGDAAAGDPVTDEAEAPVPEVADAPESAADTADATAAEPADAASGGPAATPDQAVDPAAAEPPAAGDDTGPAEPASGDGAEPAESSGS